jgi:hypothetical protein
MKTKTLFVYYLILFLTGMAISGYSQNNTNNQKKQLNTENDTLNDKDNKVENKNSFDNLNIIYSLYYCENVKMT